MPTLKVWVRKTVQGPKGTLEIGLGGTHNVTCEPHQLARERLALYQNYKSEVDRLIECELNGTSTALPGTTAQHRPEPRAAHGAEAGPDGGSEPDAQPAISIERSRQVLADLQVRLAEKGRQREASHLGRSMDELLDAHRKES